MKRFSLLLLGFCLATSLQAQRSEDSPPTAKLTMEELDELLGPIALYPDALIALILPASTFPSDVVLGARFVAADGDPARVEDKAWDSSVKALTRYPDTLKWLDDNLEWTTQVGDAFIDQPAEVMNSIQQLRAKAKALGNLNDTPEQRIVQDDRDIRIIPAQPNYIYEPRYDPEVIYEDRQTSQPLLYFGSGYGVGSWLDSDVDWHRRRLYRGEWHEGWDYNRDNDRDRDRRDREEDRYINRNLTNSRVWQPDPVRHRAQSQHLAERVSNIARSSSRDSSNNGDRSSSRDSKQGESKNHHAGISRPKAILGAPHHPETIKRAESRDNGRMGNDNKSDDNRKGHVAVPKSVAPEASNRKGSDARDNVDHKKSNKEMEHDSRRADVPNKKEGDAPRRDSRTEEPKHIEAPKHHDAPKTHEEPKHEAPKQEAPKHREEPKREAPKQEAPRHQEAPKREAPKPQAEPSKERGKHGDKKKDDDKDKK